MGGKARLTQAEFEERSSAAHENFYDYSKSVYTIGKDKLIVTCPLHGDFSIRAVNHISGVGCPKCKGGVPHNTEEFIKRATLKHGQRYLYNLVDYVSAQIKVQIVCKEHGSFWQLPQSHLRGSGCQICSERLKLTQTQFEVISREIHGSFYDYSKSKYKSMYDKVVIVCPKHGEFMKTPLAHIHKKSGCPSCVGYGFNSNKDSVFYLIRWGDKVTYGVTNNSKSRFSTYKTDFKKMGVDAKIVFTSEMIGSAALTLEKLVSVAFDTHKVFVDRVGFKSETLVSGCLEELITFLVMRLKSFDLSTRQLYNTPKGD